MGWTRNRFTRDLLPSFRKRVNPSLTCGIIYIKWVISITFIYTYVHHGPFRNVLLLIPLGNSSHAHSSAISEQANEDRPNRNHTPLRHHRSTCSLPSVLLAGRTCSPHAHAPRSRGVSAGWAQWGTSSHRNLRETRRPRRSWSR